MVGNASSPIVDRYRQMLRHREILAWNEYRLPMPGMSNSRKVTVPPISSDRYEFRSYKKGKSPWLKRCADGPGRPTPIESFLQREDEVFCL